MAAWVPAVAEKHQADCVATRKADPANKRLTGKEQAFIHAYARHWNAARAVREAGYETKDPYQYAYELKTKPHISKHIEAARAEMEQRHIDLDHQATALLQAQVAADPRLMFDDAGQPRPIHTLGDDEAALVNGFEVEQETSGAWGASKTTRLSKLRLADRRGAAEAVKKYVGNYRDKAARRGFPGTEGIAQPVEEDTVDIVIKARRVAFALALGTQALKKQPPKPDKA